MSETLTSDGVLSPPDTGRHTLWLCDGRCIQIRRMQRWDRHDVTTFFRRLAREARPLLPDVRDNNSVDTWISEVESGRTVAILAAVDDRVIAYAGLRSGNVPWMAHAADLSLAVASDWQSLEVGEHLWRGLMAAVAAPQQLRKLVAPLKFEQVSERAMLERLGFVTEGLLVDHVIDEAGDTRDLLIMARALERSFVVEREGLAPATEVRSQALARNDNSVRAAAVLLLPAPMAIRYDRSAQGLKEASHGKATAGLKLMRPRAKRSAVASGRLVAAAVIPLALLLIGGIVYFARRPTEPPASQVLGQSVAPSAAATPTTGPFSASRTGTSTAYLPPIRPAMAVRVTVEPGAVGSWFWCVESSFGIPLAEHHCASAHTARPEDTGELVTDTVVDVDPSWPADALYFVAMYCEGPCAWYLAVTPAGAPAATR